MERMEKEKESGTLLGVGTAYMEVHTFEGVDYITVKDFNKAINHLQIEIGGVMGERDGKQMRIEELEEENKKLKSDLSECECSMHFENDEVGYRKRENKKLKEDADYFRQCYLDLKKLCEKEGFMLSDEEVTKMFNLDKRK